MSEHLSNLGSTSNPVTHDPLRCEICHAEGISAEIADLQARAERLQVAIERHRSRLHGELGEIVAWRDSRDRADELLYRALTPDAEEG